MANSVVGPGDIIAGRYRIERLLGQGGMGSVYEALQLSLQRRVALKLLVDENLEHPAHAARFEREAVALARLTDPHTVRLFDFGTDERRRPFLVMELLKGCDLANDLARHGPMRWDQALQVSRQVLASLAEAHGAGLIHRDIKPANLFLCAGPEWPVVRVLDFGIATATERDRATRKLTLTGTVLGSAPYMSPEQAQAQAAGPAADLYALGVVLFELLTGRTPFEGRTFTGQLLGKVMERAPGLRELRPELDLPGGVEELVAELLERDVAARPPSARAVAERMKVLLEGVSLPPLVREVEAVGTVAAVPAPLTFPRAEPGTEPMLLPPTLDNCWTPQTVAPQTVTPQPVTPQPVAPHDDAPPVAPAPRGRLALAASALLVSVAVLGWQLRPSSRADESVIALEPAPPALAAYGPSAPGAGVEARAESVLASADPEPERNAAAAGSKGDTAASADTSHAPQPKRKASKATVPAHARAPHPRPAAKALAEAAPARAAVPPVAEPRAEEPPVWRAPPSPDPVQLPRAAPAAEPPPQQSVELTPAQSDELSAALSERRQFARSRAIREYREGLLDHSELKTRLREIDREFAAAPRWEP